MAEYTVGEALKKLLEHAGWTDKMYEYRLKQEWAQVVGNTIARHTHNIKLYKKVLYLNTDVAPLKQEIRLGKEQLIERINQYFEARVVLDIKVG